MGVDRTVIFRVEMVEAKVGAKLKCVEIFRTLKGEFPKMTSAEHKRRGVFANM